MSRPEKILKVEATPEDLLKLFLAIAKKEEEEIDRLIDEILPENLGLPVQLSSGTVETPLTTAIALKDEKTIKKLIAKGVKLDFAANKNLKILERLSQIVESKPALIELLIENGENFEQSAFLHKVQEQNTNLLQILVGIEKVREQLESKDEYGKTPLSCAVGQQNSEAVKILLAAGANPNSKDDDGMPILLAALTDEAITKALLDSGADVNISHDVYGTTPLGYACSIRRNEAIVQMLIDKGAKVTWNNLLEATRACLTRLRGRTSQVAGTEDTDNQPTINIIQKKLEEQLKPIIDQLHLDIKQDNNENLSELIRQVKNTLPTATDQALASALLTARQHSNSKAIEILKSEKEILKTEKTAATRNLQKAVSKDQVEEITDLVMRGADVNSLAQDSDKISLLHEAVFNRKEKMVEALLKNGADPNRNYHPSFTPIEIAMVDAVNYQDTAIVKKLLEAGAVIKIISSENLIAIPKLLELALKQNDRELITNSLRAISPDHRDYIDDNINSWKLFSFVTNVETKLWLARELAKKIYGIKNETGLTDLHLAIFFRQKDLALELLKQGADVNALSYLGRNALFFLVSGSKFSPADISLARILISNGAEVDRVDNLGETLLSGAIITGNPELFELFLKEGAKIENVKLDKLPSGISRPGSNFQEVVKILLANGIEPASLVDEEGRGPIHYLALGDKKILGKADDNAIKDMIRFFISCGFDANTKDKDGNTPLHLAVLNNRPQIAKLLQSLTRNSIDTIRNNDGKTASDLAQLKIAEEQAKRKETERRLEEERKKLQEKEALIKEQKLAEEKERLERKAREQAERQEAVNNFSRSVTSFFNQTSILGHLFSLNLSSNEPEVLAITINKKQKPVSSSPQKPPLSSSPQKPGAKGAGKRKGGQSALHQHSKSKDSDMPALSLPAAAISDSSVTDSAKSSTPPQATAAQISPIDELLKEVRSAKIPKEFFDPTNIKNKFNEYALSLFSRRNLEERLMPFMANISGKADAGILSFSYLSSKDKTQALEDKAFIAFLKRTDKSLAKIINDIKTKALSEEYQQKLSRYEEVKKELEEYNNLKSAVSLAEGERNSLLKELEKLEEIEADLRSRGKALNDKQKDRIGKISSELLPNAQKNLRNKNEELAQQPQEKFTVLETERKELREYLTIEVGSGETKKPEVSQQAYRSSPSLSHALTASLDRSPEKSKAEKKEGKKEWTEVVSALNAIDVQQLPSTALPLPDEEIMALMHAEEEQRRTPSPARSGTSSASANLNQRDIILALQGNRIYQFPKIEEMGGGGAFIFSLENWKKLFPTEETEPKFGKKEYRQMFHVRMDNLTKIVYQRSVSHSRNVQGIEDYARSAFYGLFNHLIGDEVGTKNTFLGMAHMGAYLLPGQTGKHYQDASRLISFMDNLMKREDFNLNSLAQIVLELDIGKEEGKSLRKISEYLTNPASLSGSVSRELETVTQKISPIEHLLTFISKSAEISKEYPHHQERIEEILEKIGSSFARFESSFEEFEAILGSKKLPELIRKIINQEELEEHQKILIPELVKGMEGAEIDSEESQKFLAKSKIEMFLNENIKAGILEDVFGDIDSLGKEIAKEKGAVKDFLERTTQRRSLSTSPAPRGSTALKQQSAGLALPSGQSGLF